MKFVCLLLTVFIFTLTSCNLSGPVRNPANEVYEETDEPVALGQIKLSTIKNGLYDIARKSPMIHRIHHFDMDPVTRIIKLDLTVNYPLTHLFNFTKTPVGKINDKHRIELAVSLPETKKLAFTRYLGLTFHKFTIDGDDYLDAFDIVASVVQTLLANSELIDFVATKIPEAEKGKIDPKELLREIIDSNGIVVFHTTKKINFKIDLAKFSHISPYIEEYENLRLWRLSPTLFQGKEVRFKLIAGEGKPTKAWMQEELGRITDDSRTLLQVRNDLYQEFSDIENVEIANKKYLEELLANESINPVSLRKNYVSEINQFLDDLESRARETLNRDNDNFIADPEYEYIRYTDIAKNHIRNYVSDLDRRLSVDHNILAGGSVTTKNRPLVTKMVSETLLNKGINFVTDTEFEKTQVLSEASVHLLPQLPGLIVKGRINLPLKFIMSKMDTGLADIDLKSHVVGINEGFPFELKLEMKMGDHGVLALDIMNLKVESGKTKLSINKKSSNHQFLIDLAKIFISENLASLKIDLKEEQDPEAAKEKEIEQIVEFLAALKDSYSDSSNLLEYFNSDITNNPYNTAGKKYLEIKQQILIGDLINYNHRTKMFEIRVDPSVAFDEVAGVKHKLELWGITPLYSKALNNTFLEVSLGKGLRAKQYIDSLYKRSGTAENSQFSGIYYELGKERSNIDMLASIHFEHINKYINEFLSDMVKANGTNAVEQAQDSPGDSFYEISSIQVNITPDKKFHLDLKLKMAKMARTFSSLWTRRELQEDTFTVNGYLELSGTEAELNNQNHSLKDLTYFNSAIQIDPTQVRISSGRPSLVNNAVTFLLNSAVKLGLNNNTVRKLLMKVVSGALDKMYSKRNTNKILGHSMEKIARLRVKNNKILLYLNPKLSGPAFDVQLADEKELNKGIKLDAKNQTLHVGMTVGAAVSKLDKVKLVQILKEMDTLLGPILAANSKEKLQKLLKDGQLVGKLLTNSDKSKMGLYNQFKNILSKYDQVLHVTRIKHTSANERKRISATGAELMYFAGIASAFEEKLTLLTTKLRKYGLTSKNDYYPTYIKSLNIVSNNIKRPLISEYEKRAKDINKTILNNEISFWTYTAYPNAYFANSIYETIR